MKSSKYEIAYVVSDLKRVGPSNQTLNIIKNSPIKEKCLVITLFNEPKDSMIDEYKNNNIEVVSLQLSRVLFYINGKKKLFQALKKYRIRLAHSYGIKPDYLCQKACNKLNLVHIITLRNYPKEDILKRMNFIKGHTALHNHICTLKKAQNIIACSKTIERKMKKDYPNMNISSIQNGVDVEKYKKVTLSEKKKIRKELDLPLDKKIFISTSSFTKRKRIGETIEAFINFNEDNNMLILLGDGEEFETLSNRYSNNNAVLFLGKSDKIPKYLNASDFFISSSESEGLPNGVIEAISCGIPVILSNIEQHIEVLNEIPYSGITYELYNIRDLTNKMHSIQNFDNSKSNILASNLTMKNMAEKYFEYYSKALKDFYE